LPRTGGGALFHSSDDPEVQAVEADALRRIDEQFGKEQVERARGELRKAIDDSRTLLASQRHASIMNLRDKHLAHALYATRREKAGPLPPVKYGDERDMLEATLSIVEALYVWVNSTSLSFQDSREIDRENAKALWEACTFNITNNGGET